MTGACGFMKRKASARVQITSQFVGAAGGTAGGATARYRLNSTGIAEQKSGLAAYSTLETWLLTGVNSDYEVRFTQTGGSGSAGGVGASWLLLSTAREITLLGSLGTVVNAFVMVEIRDKVTLAVLDTASVELESEFI